MQTVVENVRNLVKMYISIYGMYWFASKATDLARRRMRKNWKKKSEEKLLF